MSFRATTKSSNPKASPTPVVFLFFVFTPRKNSHSWGTGFSMTQLLHSNLAEMPMKVIYLSPGLEYDENIWKHGMRRFSEYMGISVLEYTTLHIQSYYLNIYIYIYIFCPKRRNAGMPWTFHGIYIYIYIMRCSMYGIFTYIYPKNGPNVGKYSIHGASGIYSTIYTHWFLVFFTALCAMSCRSRSRR